MVRYARRNTLTVAIVKRDDVQNYAQSSPCLKLPLQNAQKIHRGLRHDYATLELENLA